MQKVKQLERSTKEELSRAKLDHSLNVEEYLKKNSVAYSRYGSRAGVVTGPISSMQNRFLDFNKLKRKYEVEGGIRATAGIISGDLDAAK